MTQTIHVSKFAVNFHLFSIYEAYFRRISAITLGYSKNRNYENNDDFSHEGPQDPNKHYNSPLKNKPVSTSFSMSPIGATTTEDVLSGTQVNIKSRLGS